MCDAAGLEAVEPVGLEAVDEDLEQYIAADYAQFEAWVTEEQCEEEAQEEEAVVQAAGSAASPQGQSHLALSSHHGKGVSTEQLRRDVFPPGEKPFPRTQIHSGCVGPEIERSFHRGAPHNSQRRLGQHDRSTEEILKDGEAWQSIPQVQWKVQLPGTRRAAVRMKTLLLA